jgi:hypothetical protein
MRIKGFMLAKCFLYVSLYRNVLCANLPGTLRWTSLYPNVRKPLQKSLPGFEPAGMGRRQLEGEDLKTAAVLLGAALLPPVMSRSRESF